MRRWPILTLALLALLGSAACTGPSGLDRDLTDDWSALPAATAFVPESGVCHPERGDADATDERQVDCRQAHDTETVLAGTLAGPDLTETAPPAAGSPTLRAARSRCDQAANRLLGADWHGGRLDMDLLVPSRAAWSRGARWFRCDLFETYRLGSDSGIPRPRQTSLAGALRPGSPLAHTCFQSQSDGAELTGLIPQACTAPHDTEFAGVYTAPVGQSRPALTRDSGPVQRGCRDVIARFANVPGRDLARRTGLIWRSPPAPDWRDGDRTILCFLLTDRSLKRSMRGAGPTALPIR